MYESKVSVPRDQNCVFSKKWKIRTQYWVKIKPRGFQNYESSPMIGCVERSPEMISYLVTVRSKRIALFRAEFNQIDNILQIREIKNNKSPWIVWLILIIYKKIHGVTILKSFINYSFIIHICVITNYIVIK
jgi:hypothetical protein